MSPILEHILLMQSISASLSRLSDIALQLRSISIDRQPLVYERLLCEYVDEEKMALSIFSAMSDDEFDREDGSEFAIRRNKYGDVEVVHELCLMPYDSPIDEANEFEIEFENNSIKNLRIRRDMLGKTASFGEPFVKYADKAYAVLSDTLANVEAGSPMHMMASLLLDKDICT